MNLGDMERGVRVRVTHLGSTSNLFCPPEYLGRRREGLLGTLYSPLEQQVAAGEWWWVRDAGRKPGDKDWAPYHFSELELDLTNEPDSEEEEESDWDGFPLGPP